MTETLGGLRVQENPYLPRFEWVGRTWHERLLSWPWRPWVKIKKVPVMDAYMVGNVIHVTPEAMAALRRNKEENASHEIPPSINA